MLSPSGEASPCCASTIRARDPAAGSFEDGTLALWLEESLAAVDQLTDGPLVLVGSSMGGWIALHLAQLRPERIRALVGIAAAPDFTDWGFTDGGRQPSERGHRPALSGNPASSCFCLDGEIAVDCPVRLIHGENDSDVPLDVAFRTMRALRSADVQLNVIKGGGHRLSEPHEIDAILRTVADLLEPAP